MIFTEIEHSLKQVEKWVEKNDYKGYEPFDGLSSPLSKFTYKNIFLKRLLMQLVRQSPINLRPLLGVKPMESTIGRGYMVSGYCNMYRITNDISYKNKAENCLNWLINHKSSNYEDYSWGKHFDFASRGGIYKAFEPILIWTALIGHAFLEAYEIFKNITYLEIADSICKWILKLPRNHFSDGFCLGYHNNDFKADIHNSNMVGAALLARTAKHKYNREYSEVAKNAMSFSCNRQLNNGAWLYGEDPKNNWIDNFHTGYNIDALKCYIENSNDHTYDEKLKKGFIYYRNTFFEETGRPRYYHNRTYPVDSQCASQAIDTLSNFVERDKMALNLALKVSQWTIKNMQDKKGFFYYRQYPGGIKCKTPMLHWAQATIYKSLTSLRYQLKNTEGIL